MEALIACEPDILQVSSLPSSLDTDQRVLGQLSDLYDRELVTVIGISIIIFTHLFSFCKKTNIVKKNFFHSQTGWAKQIPGFGNLALNDQMRLLQSTWAEILTFSLAWRSVSNSGRLRFAQDFALDERLARECHCLELYSHVNTIFIKKKTMFEVFKYIFFT